MVPVFVRGAVEEAKDVQKHPKVWIRGFQLLLDFNSCSTICLFSFSQVCSLLSWSLALEALLIGVRCKKRYINV